MWTWGRCKTPTGKAEENGSTPSLDVLPEASGKTTLLEPKDSQLPLGKIEALLLGCRDRIREQIVLTKNMSEKEIMAIGNIVQNIVNHTRQYIEESKLVLVNTFAKQSLSLSEYLTSTSQVTEGQRQTVKEALALSDDIAHAGQAVDKLANQARLLALNAKIEAARLGSSGSTFSIITEQMNHLSIEIGKTNRLISDSTQAIRACLPLLAEQATSQIKRLETFSETMHALKDSIEKSISATNDTSNSHINQILNLAYEALSHLQFQDPMMQNVQRIDNLIKEFHQEISTALGISTTTSINGDSYMASLQTKPAEPVDNAAAAPDAGEVLLF